MLKKLLPIALPILFATGLALTAIAATQTTYTNDNNSRQFTTSIKDSYSASEPKDIQVSFTNRGTSTKPAGLGVQMRVNNGETQQILDANDTRANRIVNLGILPSGQHSLAFTIPDGCGNFYGYSQFDTETRFDNEYNCEFGRTITVGNSDIRGCTNSSATNYEPSAGVDDGSCEFPEDSEGCTDSLALNYNPNAETNDGSCVYGPGGGGIQGCTNPQATNYNPEATISSNSCEYGPGETAGCTDPEAGNYNPDATVDNGSCTTYTYGCVDRRALNYNPNATASNNTCLYDPLVTSSDFECSINNESWFDCEGRTFTLRDPSDGIFVRTDNENAGTWSDWCTGDLNNGVQANFGPASGVGEFSRNARVGFDFEQEGTLFDMVLCLDPNSSTRSQSSHNIKLKVLNMEFIEN